ncbi:MAG: MFS transporter [Bacteroidales bacterium]
MTKKPALSFWQIWNMSFGFLGIQFGFALQNANVSRIFETLGASIDNIPILWIAAPVTGLIVQPIIGHMSDRTWNRLGRRRPYFLTGAILASAALFLMPNSPVLWVAAGMLWIMDASINISMEPFRAFVGDMLPSHQRTMGFSMQSFFIGTGAIIASALPWVLTNWFNIPNVAAEGEIPPSVKFAFYIGGMVFFLAVLWTVVSSKEYSPEEMEAFEAADEQNHPGNERDSLHPVKDTRLFRNGVIWLLTGLTLFFLFDTFIYMDYGLGVFFGGIAMFGLLQILTGLFTRQGKTHMGLVTIINDLYYMPGTMKQLAGVQFFSWFALFSMWIYTTAGVTSTKYDMVLSRSVVMELSNEFERLSRLDEADQWKHTHEVGNDLGNYRKKLDAGEEEVISTVRLAGYFTDPHKADLLMLSPETTARLLHIQQEYNRGADWVGVLMAVYNGFAAIMAFVIMLMARVITRKKVHFICLVVGGLSLISFYLIPDPRWLLVSELGIGLAWASILAMPYAILTGSLPPKKLGVYMGIFNFFIVIPQITAAAMLGFVVRTLFDQQAIYALVLGGASMILAAILVLFVHDVDEGINH